MTGLGRLAARATIGGLMFGHGAQKLFGWFGGHGPEGTGQFFESIGFRPGRKHAMAAGAAEAGGGLLLALGLATPAAAAAITSVMVSAIRSVHWKNGVWSSSGGYEYNAVLIAAVAALTEMGPGPLSLDAVLGTERRGTKWALAALGAGAVGAAAIAARQPQQDEPAEDTATAREAGDAVPAEAHVAS
jgi:putative oxidoreductase